MNHLSHTKKVNTTKVFIVLSLTFLFGMRSLNAQNCTVNATVEETVTSSNQGVNTSSISVN